MNRDGERMRDEALSAALGKLEVPEHAPGFKARLRARLHEEVAARGPEGGAGSTTHLPPTRGPRLERRPRRWITGWYSAAAAVVALIVVALSLGDTGIRPRAAGAAEVRGAVARAWATIESVRGTLVSKSSMGPEQREREQRWNFVITARGDLRLTGLARPGDVAYDAVGNVERGLNPSESIPDSDVLFGAEIKGLAPGPPDHTSSIEIFDRNLGSVVRALASSRGGTVSETSYEGRKAWVMETELPLPDKDREFWPDHLEVVVDQETGFPVRAVMSRSGAVLSEMRILDLEVGGDVPRSAFIIEFPPGGEVFRSDAGFRRVTLDEARAAVGYAPLVPNWIPEGYELSEVAVAERARSTGTLERNPATRMTVSISYRRGLDQFIVTTRLVGEDASAWSDPFATGRGRIAEPDRVRFSSGALTGREGELVIDPRETPHVWTLTPDLVVTVSGDLTRDELLEVAGSLEPH